MICRCPELPTSYYAPYVCNLFTKLWNNQISSLTNVIGSFMSSSLFNIELSIAGMSFLSFLILWHLSYDVFNLLNFRYYFRFFFPLSLTVGNIFARFAKTTECANTTQSIP